MKRDMNLNALEEVVLTRFDGHLGGDALQRKRE